LLSVAESGQSDSDEMESKKCRDQLTMMSEENLKSLLNYLVLCCTGKYVILVLLVHDDYSSYNILFVQVLSSPSKPPAAVLLAVSPQLSSQITCPNFFRRQFFRIKAADDFRGIVRSSEGLRKLKLKRVSRVRFFA
jgi:hypothetical protein